MNAKRYCVYISEQELIVAIEAIVQAKGWSKNDVFRESLRTYLRQDAITVELAEFERRQAATFREQGRHMRRLKNDFQILMAFFDLFARSYYVHTPSVPQEAVESAAASAKLRYERLLQQLPGVLQGATGLMQVSLGLNADFDSEAKILATDANS
jgi:hypothetical protein